MAADALRIVLTRPDDAAAGLTALAAGQPAGRAARLVAMLTVLSPGASTSFAERYAAARHSFDLPLAERLEPLVAAFTRAELARGLAPGETPLIALLRADDPALHQDVARAWSRRLGLNGTAPRPARHCAPTHTKALMHCKGAPMCPAATPSSSSPNSRTAAAALSSTMFRS